MYLRVKRNNFQIEEFLNKEYICLAELTYACILPPDVRTCLLDGKNKSKKCHICRRHALFVGGTDIYNSLSLTTKGMAHGSLIFDRFI